MATGDIKLVYGSSASLTFTSLASLASSATFVAGAEATSVSNASNLYLDELLSGLITVGTTPTANTFIEVWVIAKMNDSTWPDVFDGSDSAETVTTRDQLLAYGRLAARIKVPAATSNVGYNFAPVSLAALFGGSLPKEWTVFVTHNCGSALHATGGNHVISHTPVYQNVA